jgi:hypothetical protein
VIHFASYNLFLVKPCFRAVSRVMTVCLNLLLLCVWMWRLPFDVSTAMSPPSALFTEYSSHICSPPPSASLISPALLASSGVTSSSLDSETWSLSFPLSRSSESDANLVSLTSHLVEVASAAHLKSSQLLTDSLPCCLPLHRWHTNLSPS